MTPIHPVPAATQVAVVGAGPVGLLLAGELALGGVSVVVLDRLPSATTESRASTVHARTMELFDQRGLIERLEVSPPVSRAGHYGGIPLDVGAVPSDRAGLWKLPQARIERLLTGWAVGLGARLRREVEVVAVHPERSGVRLALSGRHGPAELSAEWVVGCDGERGRIGELVGLRREGRAARHELLRADVAGIDVPDRRFHRLPGGFAVAARGPTGVTRVMVCPHGRAPGGEISEPTFAEVVEAWRAVTGEDIGHGTPLWVNAFGDANRLVTRYRAGRVLLAGDAAHHQMPSAGLALNLGLHEAANLGWKLAARARGDADDALLDTYHDERHPVARRVLDHIDTQAGLLLGGPEVEPLRGLFAELIDRPAGRDRLAAVVSGLDVCYPDPTGAAVPAGDEGIGGVRVGARLPRLPLRGPGGPISSTEALRSGRGLLLGRSVDITRAVRHTLGTGWTGRVEPMSAHDTCSIATAGPDLVLVRPDGHVAWCPARPGAAHATGGVGLDSALCRWFGPPTGARTR